ncbi:MAG TPA: helix-turn-helix domain-containing protein [Stellaceae bacterium]|jgi:citrate synthase|nr:helix-turn-helix domain-containing protein [Stellaceae bacterium]HWZ66400.1 helix-turn-helix domain-containing protein [Stellaceae bacterium]
MAKLPTANEAAKRLGVSRQTLYAYVSRGLIKAYDADNLRERR